MTARTLPRRLLAAKAWRDDLLGTLPAISKEALVAGVKPTNISGVAGVTRTSEARAGEICHSWVAYSPQRKGMPCRTKKYPIAKHGEKEAFALAVSAREAFVAEFREVEFFQHPAARQEMRTLQIEQRLELTYE